MVGWRCSTHTPTQTPTQIPLPRTRLNSLETQQWVMGRGAMVVRFSSERNAFRTEYSWSWKLNTPPRSKVC